MIWTAVGGPPPPGGDWPVETDRERRVKVQNLKGNMAVVGKGFAVFLGGVMLAHTQAHAQEPGDSGTMVAPYLWRTALDGTTRPSAVFHHSAYTANHQLLIGFGGDWWAPRNTRHLN